MILYILYETLHDVSRLCVCTQLLPLAWRSMTAHHLPLTSEDYTWAGMATVTLRHRQGKEPGREGEHQEAGE